MNQETIDSLQTLEKELQRLRTAVDHIDQAKSVAQKVLVAVAGVQKKYSEHLDALLNLQMSAIEQLGKETNSRFDEFGAAGRRQILETASRSKKQMEEQQAEMQRALNEAADAAAQRLAEISTRADQLMTQSGETIRRAVSEAGAAAGEHVSTIGYQVRQLIEELNTRSNRLLEENGRNAAIQLQENSNKAGNLIENFGAAAQSQVKELGARAHKHIEELGGKSSAGVDAINQIAQSGLSQAIAQAKTALEETNAHSIKVFAAIKKSYDQHTLEFEKLSASTDAIVSSAARLVRNIDAVDFPDKLQVIQTDIRGLHFNLNGAMNRVDALDKSIEHTLRALVDDIVGKIGRLEMFIEKTVRNLAEETARNLNEQKEELGKTRTMVLILVVMNVLLLVGIFLLWNRDDSPPVDPAPQQSLVDSTDSVPSATPVEPAPEPARRKRR